MLARARVTCFALFAATLVACGGGSLGGGYGAPGAGEVWLQVSGLTSGAVVTMTLNGIYSQDFTGNGAAYVLLPFVSPGTSVPIVLQQGSAYGVEVRAQPGNRACAVGNYPGVVGTSNVVAVQCVPAAGLVATTDTWIDPQGLLWMTPGPVEGQAWVHDPASGDWEPVELP